MTNVRIAHGHPAQSRMTPYGRIFVLEVLHGRLPSERVLSVLLGDQPDFKPVDRAEPLDEQIVLGIEADVVLERPLVVASLVELAGGVEPAFIDVVGDLGDIH